MGNKPGQEVADGRPSTRPRPATIASFSTPSPAVTESDFLRVKGGGGDEIRKDDFLTTTKPVDPRAKEQETVRKRSDDISSALALGFAQVDTNRDGFIQPAKVLHIYREVCTLAEAVHSPPRFGTNDKVRFLQWDNLFKNIPTTDKRLNKALKQIDFSSYKDFTKNGKITAVSSPPAYIDNSTSLGTFVAPNKTKDSRKRLSMITLPSNKTTTPAPLPAILTVSSPSVSTTTITTTTSAVTSPVSPAPSSPLSYVAFDSTSTATTSSTHTTFSGVPPRSPVSPTEDASPVYIRKSSVPSIPFSVTTPTTTASPVLLTTSLSTKPTSPTTTSIITTKKPTQPINPRKQSESKSKRTKKSRKQSRKRSSTVDSDVSVGSNADSELDLEFDVNLNIDKVDADLTKKDGLKSDDDDDDEHSSSIVARANAAWSAK